MECSCRMFDRLSLLDLAGCAEGEREREGKEGGKGEGRESEERGRREREELRGGGRMEEGREKDYNCYHQLMRHFTCVYHIFIPNSNRTVTQFPKHKQSPIFMNVNSQS